MENGSTGGERVVDGGFPPDFNNISEFFFFSLFFLSLLRLIGDSLCDIFIIIFLVFFFLSSSPLPPGRLSRSR